jgi:hypothetical protein
MIHMIALRAVAAGAFALALSIPSVTAAFDGRRACADDAATLCSGAASPRTARRCLERHRDQLSTACAATFDALHRRRQAIRTVCAADVSALCPDADNGRARRQCMREHRGELSEACVETLPCHYHGCKAPD